MRTGCCPVCPFQLPYLVDRKTFPVQLPMYSSSLPTPYLIYPNLDGVPTTISLAAPRAAWIATLFALSTLMGDFMRKIILCSCILYRATHSTESQRHTSLLHSAASPK